MKEEIQSITEAFSMQPTTYHVGQKLYVAGTLNDVDIVHEIKLEHIGIGGNDPEPYYVGYTAEGKKLFQYLVKTVNVHFK